jgi:AcrR family transcriptional regulator
METRHDHVRLNPPQVSDEPLPRRDQVLAAALDLMVAEGDRVSMAAIARAAACSKETLYKWFGDKEGLLTAIVQWQAAKVAIPDSLSQSLTTETLTLDQLRAGLEAFARNWLMVISGTASIALNRMAVAHAGSSASNLGNILLHNGPDAMAARLRPIFEQARAHALIGFDAFDDAFSCFFGLVIGDLQIRLLLSGTPILTQSDMATRARRAAARFLALSGASSLQLNPLQPKKGY